MGSAGGIEERLLEILETAREEGNEGSGALLDLARAYLEDGRPDVSRALCVVGLRARSARTRAFRSASPASPRPRATSRARWPGTPKPSG